MKLANSILAAASLAALLACGGGGDEPKNRPTRPVPVPKPTPAPMASLSGRLTDKATSLALANVKVQAQAGDTLKILATATTQADGSYTLAGLPVGAPLRVVSQPVTGAVLYETYVSAPLTLAKDGAPQKADHAFASLPLGGAVDGRIQEVRGQVTRGGLLLVHRVAMPGGKTARAVVRTAANKAGPFRFEALAPGDYDLVYTRLSPHVLHPSGAGHRPRHGAYVQRVQSFTLKAGETHHVEFSRFRAQAEEVPEEAAE